MLRIFYQIIKGRLWQKDSAVPEPVAHIKLIDHDFTEISAEVITMPGAIIFDGKLFIFDRYNIYRQATVENLETIEIKRILSDAAKNELKRISVTYLDYRDDRSSVLNKLDARTSD